MRSHLAAATLVLAVGLGPALAQSPSPEAPVATGDPLAKGEPAAKADPKSPAAKKGAKEAAKGNPKTKPKADSKGDPKAAANAALVPPAAGSNAVPAPGGRNVAATGKTMPPASGRGGATPVKSSTEVEMLKAQKAAEERNKAWDAKMRRTMSTICNGC